jgi:hypothetical protein
MFFPCLNLPFFRMVGQAKSRQPQKCPKTALFGFSKLAERGNVQLVQANHPRFTLSDEPPRATLIGGFFVSGLPIGGDYFTVS